MKIRTDFVTNSSSSSFTVVVDVETKDGKTYSYEQAPCNEDGSGEVSFNGSLLDLITGKSKKLKSKYNDVEKLARFLMESVEGDMYDDFVWDDEEDEEYEEYEDASDNGLDEMFDAMKEDFVKNLVEHVSSTSDIKKIRVSREYSAWGEFADLIPDNDGPLCNFAEKVLETSGEEQKKILDEMRAYIHTSQEERRGENFACDFDDIRYAWEGADEDLIKLAERLCSGLSSDMSEGTEVEEINLETKEYAKYAEFQLN